jgi:hypothetical protein
MLQLAIQLNQNERGNNEEKERQGIKAHFTSAKISAIG